MVNSPCPKSSGIHHLEHELKRRPNRRIFMQVVEA